jgi:hypothetical protein
LILKVENYFFLVFIADKTEFFLLLDFKSPLFFPEDLDDLSAGLQIVQTDSGFGLAAGTAHPVVLRVQLNALETKDIAAEVYCVGDT